MVIEKEFYLRDDVVKIARQVLGKYIFTFRDGLYCGGIITEAEAYKGIHDRASHAFNGRRTPRTEVMFAEGGVAYVYLCYGVHSMFNIVTNRKDIPDAVLIRGIFPTHGISHMLLHAGRDCKAGELANGPGKVTKALGIHYSQSGISLTDNNLSEGIHKIWLEDRKIKVTNSDIQVTTRVGVQYSGADALRPYRFILKKKPVSDLF
ncbi:MAG: DNA-3-methyladenine glycosylase [Bacteroidetes bacterium]|nr:DNA-3-methyladenine glycosylase [Bacteroidota bacterium]